LERKASRLSSRSLVPFSRFEDPFARRIEDARQG